MADANDFLLWIKRWWLVWTIAVAVFSFLTGCVATGFVKFTVYYLAEQTSIATLTRQGAGLGAVVERLAAIDGHLARLDQTLSEQHYSDQAVTGKLDDLAGHVHALDARADTDRVLLSDFLATQRKNTEQILFLLDPKGTRKP